MRKSRSPNAVFGWALYDFGNSAFATVVVGALLPVYFEEEIVAGNAIPFFGGEWTAESLWGLVVAVGPLIMLLMMPVLGAAADRSDTKGKYLSLFTYGASVATVALFLAGRGDVFYTLGVFLVALLCFAGANVFYDSFLTDIATSETIHKISARGIAYGYVGGGIHLVLAFAMISILPEPIGSRIAIASAGVWFAVFAFVAFRHMRALPANASSARARSFRARVADGFTKTRTTLRQVRRFPHLTRFIVAYMLYGNGMQTVVALTAVYSAETLQLDQTTIIAAFLLVQILSIPACYVAARLSALIGARTTLTIVLVGWVIAISLAFTLPAGAALPYYGLAILIGLVLGPASALSRSIYASIIPQNSPAEFFGFYSLTSKFASIWGPLVFVWVRQASGSGRTAILTIAAFILVGLALFRRVDLDQAEATRDQWVSPAIT